jgi:RNA polymerase sigma factor (sigma-70 family)
MSATRTATGPPPFQVFFEEQRSVVYRFLMGAVGPHRVDDCFQETFLAALRAYPELRDASNLRSWVLTIASRKAIDAGRAERRGPMPVGDPGEVEQSAAGGAPAGDPAMDGRIDPGERLWAAVQALPVRQRTALVQRHVLDWSYRQIAEAMASTEETARANVHQALKALRSKGDRLTGEDG